MPIDQLQSLMMNQSFEIQVMDTKQGIKHLIDYKWKRPLGNLEVWFDNSQPTFKVCKYRRNLLGDEELVGSDIMYVKEFEVEWEKYHKDDLPIRVIVPKERLK